MATRKHKVTGTKEFERLAAIAKLVLVLPMQMQMLTGSPHEQRYHGLTWDDKYQQGREELRTPPCHNRARSQEENGGIQWCRGCQIHSVEPGECTGSMLPQHRSLKEELPLEQARKQPCLWSSGSPDEPGLGDSAQNKLQRQCPQSSGTKSVQTQGASTSCHQKSWE
ncbi:hypothetical protein UPYG_G00301330 [Umbra pygmaea]|uniref:Uncharacterized protein n=1 Tax=Umbra pygmaea TaxID=75934 RepID=A0ABD0WMX6_UMBPY